MVVCGFVRYYCKHKNNLRLWILQFYQWHIDGTEIWTVYSKSKLPFLIKLIRFGTICIHVLILQWQTINWDLRIPRWTKYWLWSSGLWRRVVTDVSEKRITPILYPEDRSGMFHGNVRKHLQDHMASQCRRTETREHSLFAWHVHTWAYSMCSFSSDGFCCCFEQLISAI
jgi:hypothetical protein